ncbi:MAG: FkbM family methyltransferase [Chlorogloeopsis fritschii C42_A2020_084]|uniref:FkbM family methyltransferase n=1 Tax=Chlorogloeopsis fritschii TaxID=1124 RepID=UPI0019F726E3|nr:FkbM family methyltransferase [Chlorogloeopsis fritschii]MBF2009310.1 FkbM family methyltransferase [Chlorogloeopsis fritschii C42_A2020_084]
MSVFVKKLKEKGLLEQIHMTVCIVGSRKLSSQDDYGAGSWNVFNPNLTIYGFDADADACEAAEAELKSRQISWTEKHIPLALGKSTGETTLYVTKHPMCSSLYPPNELYIERFANLSELCSLDFTIGIETTTLDEFCHKEGIEQVDFLHIDVQGADLQVLEGSADILKRSVLGVQVEVEFSPLYLNQPLFADVDIYLRKYGFTLFDLATAYRPRARSPIVSTNHPGQLLWGDAYYLQDPIKENANLHIKEPAKILKLACLADVLGFSDYALELLEYLTVNYGANQKYNFAHTIIESLSQFPELVEPGLDTLPVVTNISPYLNI